MRVALIQKDPLPDPRRMALAAATVFRGHQVTVFIPAAERRLDRAMRRFAPDLILFSPATGFHKWALGMAQRIRKISGGAPNVFTGSYASEHPEIALEDAVDLILLGDPETTLPEVLTKLERGHGKSRDLPGTTGTVAAGPDGGLLFGAERQAIDDIDELPLADMEIYRRYPFVRDQSTLCFTTGRGVLENTHAGFRIGHKELERRFQPCRRHSPQEAIRRLHLHIHRRPIYRRVAFRDDSLLQETDGSWLTEFLESYGKNIGLPFSCVARPDQLSAATIALLANAGCDRVKLGVESGDPELRKALCGVEISDTEILEANAALREQGIDVHTITFLGLPNETMETALRGLDLNIAIKPSHAFAIEVDDAQSGDLQTPLSQLQMVFPLVVRMPALRSKVEGALREGNSWFLKHLFQLHHDASFVTSGELSPFDLLRIAASMSRSRNKVEQNMSEAMVPP